MTMTMTIAIAASGLPRGARSTADSREVGPVLDTAHIAGSFSLIDGGPVIIDAVCGLVVHARRGSLWITQHGDRKDYTVGTGQRFVADRAGPLVVSALGIGEVRVDWPGAEFERLSHGLEPGAVAV